MGMQDMLEARAYVHDYACTTTINSVGTTVGTLFLAGSQYSSYGNTALFAFKVTVYRLTYRLYLTPGPKKGTRGCGLDGLDLTASWNSWLVK